MAITSEIIGKLGGADVETIPVSAPEGDHLLCSLDLEEDKTYLVGVTGVSSKAPSHIYSPHSLYRELHLRVWRSQKREVVGSRDSVGAGESASQLSS